MSALVVEQPMSPNGISAVDVGDVSDAGLIDMMVAARRAASRLQAVELAAVAELARRRDAEGEVSGVGLVAARDYLNDEVASALTLTEASADDLVRFATELTGRLPATFAALASGELDHSKARAVWRATAQVRDEIAAEIETRVLSRAVGQTTGEIRAKIRRLVRRLDPDALARRRERAERGRDVHLVQTDEGTAHLSGLDLPVDAATAARNRVNAIAAGLKSDGDQRGIGQLRADVFLALLSGTLTATEPPVDSTRHQTTPTPARHEDDWTGIDDAIADAIAQAARDQLTTLPAEFLADGAPARPREFTELIAQAVRGRSAGWAALSGEVRGRGVSGRYEGLAEFIVQAARGRSAGWAALSGEVRGRDVPDRYRGLAELVVTAGECIVDALAPLKTRWCVPASGPGHGHQGYRVPARMRRLIEHRDRRCGFPGCRRPVRYCDADHTIAYHRGGPTCPCNLAMLCRHHHALKQTPGWRLHQLWPGVLLWIGPTGHWRLTTPRDRE